MTTEQKMCFTCREMKPLSCFNPRHAGGTKLHSSCKVCMAAEAKRQRKAGSAKGAATMQRRRAA